MSQNQNLSAYESQVLAQGLRDVGNYFNRCFDTAKAKFFSGHSLQQSIHLAKKQYGF